VCTKCDICFYLYYHAVIYQDGEKQEVVETVTWSC
jgi:hypothetical protein